MKVVRANINDLSVYNLIYEEYVKTQMCFIPTAMTNVVETYSSYDFDKRNRIFLEHEAALVLLIKESEDVVGFVECNLAGPDALFENKYVYVSNLYFKEKVRCNREIYVIAKELMLEIELWAKCKKIDYVCSDFFCDNPVMKYVSKLLGFEEYKIRCIKKL